MNPSQCLILHNSSGHDDKKLNVDRVLLQLHAILLNVIIILEAWTLRIFRLECVCLGLKFQAANDDASVVCFLSIIFGSPSNMQRLNRGKHSHMGRRASVGEADACLIRVQVVNNLNWIYLCFVVLRPLCFTYLTMRALSEAKARESAWMGINRLKKTRIHAIHYYYYYYLLFIIKASSWACVCVCVRMWCIVTAVWICTYQLKCQCVPQLDSRSF